MFCDANNLAPFISGSGSGSKFIGHRRPISLCIWVLSSRCHFRHLVPFTVTNMLTSFFSLSKRSTLSLASSSGHSPIFLHGCEIKSGSGETTLSPHIHVFLLGAFYVLLLWCTHGNNHNIFLLCQPMYGPAQRQHGL